MFGLLESLMLFFLGFMSFPPLFWSTLQRHPGVLRLFKTLPANESMFDSHAFHLEIKGLLFHLFLTLIETCSTQACFWSPRLMPISVWLYEFQHQESLHLTQQALGESLRQCWLGGCGVCCPDDGSALRAGVPAQPLHREPHLLHRSVFVSGLQSETRYDISVLPLSASPYKNKIQPACGECWQRKIYMRSIPRSVIVLFFWAWRILYYYARRV